MIHPFTLFFREFTLDLGINRRCAPLRAAACAPRSFSDVHGWQKLRAAGVTGAHGLAPHARTVEFVHVSTKWKFVTCLLSLACVQARD